MTTAAIDTAAIDVDSWRRRIRLDTEANYHYSMGNALLVQGQRADAAACFERALALLPDCAKIRHNMGLAGEGGGPTDAVARGGSVDATDAAAGWADLGQSFALQNRNDEALAAFRNAVAADAGHTPGLIGLGIALVGQGAFVEAAQHLEQAYALDPDAANFRHLSGIFIQEGGRHHEAGRWLEAAGFMRLAARVKPDRVGARAQLALALEAHGFFIYNLVKLLRRGENLQMARTYMEGRFSWPRELPIDWRIDDYVRERDRVLGLAAAAYQQAIALAPADLSHYRGLARTFQGMDDNDGAKATYVRALALAPHDPSIIAGYGGALGEMGLYAEALEICLSARSLGATDVWLPGYIDALKQHVDGLA